MKRILLLLLAVGVIGGLAPLTYAQDEVATQEATIELQSDTQIFTRTRETERITQLRTLYRNQVEVYRNAENAFSIAKTNYQQVQTLAALEEAVHATKQVMQERSRVMITYLELLDAVLVETAGIELDLKNQSHTELVGLIQALKIHQENITVSQDRQAMATLADQFEPVAISYESAVYKALSLVRIGKIQEVRDKSEIIKADIEARHAEQEVSSSVIARRRRAYAEIERNFDMVNQNLAELNETFLEANRDGFTLSFYQNILEDLAPIYAQISRSLDHLEELITL